MFGLRRELVESQQPLRTCKVLFCELRLTFFFHIFKLVVDIKGIEVMSLYPKRRNILSLDFSERGKYLILDYRAISLICLKSSESLSMEDRL